jgi:hypothetical protein
MRSGDETREESKDPSRPDLAVWCEQKDAGIYLVFNVAVTWIQLTPGEAQRVGAQLLNKAAQLNGGYAP